MIQNCKILTVKLVKLSDPSDLWSGDLWSEWSNIEGRESVALAITGKPMQRPSACVACRYSQGIMGWLHLSFWSRLSFCLVGGLRTTSTANAGRWQWSTMKCLVYCIGCSNGARTALWASKCMFFDPLWKVVAIVLQRWSSTLLCDALCIASGPIRNTYVDDKIITSCLVHAMIQRKGRHLQS